MALKIEQIGGFNVFEWDAFKCPICKGGKFVSHDHSAVWCDGCNAKFQTRDTAGDPGVVVDCWIASDERAYVYAPLYECDKCKVERGLFEWQDKTCPSNMNHQMERVESTSVPWNAPEGFGKRYCLILKLGDYCSGWSNVEQAMRQVGDEKMPTQVEWDLYQEKLEAEQAMERMMAKVLV